MNRKKIVFMVSVLFFGIIFILLTSPYVTGKNSLPDIKDLKLESKVTDLKSSCVIKPDINFGKIPLYFIHNKGQVNKKALFYAKTPKYTLWITKDGLVFDSIKSSRNKKQNSKKTDPDLNSKLKTQNPKLTFRDVSRLIFLGANKNPEVVPLNTQKLKVNYFKGKDKSKWRGNVPTSASVLYKNLYKNIDLKIYGVGKQIEYDWIVKPGGDPSEIKFEYKNVKAIRINEEGDLDIKTEVGTLVHKKPLAYQKTDGEDVKNSSDKLICQTKVDARFTRLGKSQFAFSIGDYDKNKELVIDPVVLAYSTYIGGSYGESGYGITVDNKGYIYVTGSTQSQDFPTLNQYQELQGYEDAFIIKIDPSQKGTLSLLYSAFLGGTESDSGLKIACNKNNYIYVVGTTLSSDFPIINQYQVYQGAQDGFVLKMDMTQTGVSSLLYSTYLGGSSYETPLGIAADSSGYVYVTGHTNSSDFPVLNQYQGYQGNKDAFLTKIDMTQSGTSSLLYSTYLGGSSLDWGRGISVDSSGYVYLVGTTWSSDFPTLNQYQEYNGGFEATFVTKIDTTQIGAFSLLYSTYLGGGSTTFGNKISAKENGHVYISGGTSDPDFPILNPYQGLIRGLIDVFITKIDTTQIGASSLLYSTFLGGKYYDMSYGIAADDRGYVYVSGITKSPNFPIFHPFQKHQIDEDVFVVKLDTSQSTSSGLLFSTYLGGNSYESCSDIAVDNNGNVYVVGTTRSSDFPTFNGYQGDQGSSDIFVTKLSLDSTKGYTIISDVSGGRGRVTPATQTVKEGDDAIIKLTANSFYYEIDTILDNGVSRPVSNPYIIRDVHRNHNVVITFKFRTYKIMASVLGSKGKVFPATQWVTSPNGAKIEITPDMNYEISDIIDNGTSMPINNPYIIYRVWENHNVMVSFSHITYPPILSLSCERKTERAWIIERDYSVLYIQIEEHLLYPKEVSSFILYRRVNSKWKELAEFTSSGSYNYIDKYFKTGAYMQYKLAAFAPDGSIIAERWAVLEE